ncbi:IclR family transcriptional regulator [Cupriavidus gilardii]|uniref:IclR family transcriptional regulator n=1 Tax=Cupriavidus gilardii TaxID=82541 RepID=A0A6N1B8E8_9BURK|nr:IclR family transcriptional regulator [Cupriavidus gilardii]KAB0599226.1 IclR family transcriptional regulator [Cupriavidus gilardii]MCT9013328.1 IclR family transcriptional regulator [Cupriavidus gilardii]MCT9052882.1 IclR family transcriptional regulator [Cupriavidus gilardii]MCT9071107.1 IclR family transcriptional regulator [Cupriavidus gilardii]NNH12358.1 IclR family transcriptional regulator [Cupriavidus gilardii]
MKGSAERDDDDARGGVTAVSRALMVLEAFGVNDADLPLAEISRRTGIHKTTVLRLARTLAAHNYLVQKEDGNWRLGRAAGWLGACYQATFNVQEVVEPVLRELSRKTGESASFYVREGDERACLLRVEGPQAIRHHVRIGSTLPLDKGAPGRVILAFSGASGRPYEAIRQRGFHLSMGEREPEVSSVAAPVFGLHWRLLGSICISGPTSRLTEARLLKMAKTVVEAANRLSYAMAGSQRPAPRIDAPATWHP